MEYERAVELAPPGWGHFTLADLDRLPSAVRARELARVPDAERSPLARGDATAVERARRAFFWTFVYHLEPERWHALAQAEPVSPELLDALPSHAARALDVGAGSGRLTERLMPRVRYIVAIEPAAGLRRLLAERIPHAGVVAGWAEALPLLDSAADLTAACGAFGPEPAILDELWRVTAPGGTVALISPECPEWFVANGWSRVTAPRIAPLNHERWIDDFFGPPDPPHELVMKQKAA